MKKELIGVLICTLLITTVVLPVSGTLNSVNIKLEGQQSIVEDINEVTDEALTYISQKNMEPNTISGELKEVMIGTTIYVDDDNTEGPWYGTIDHPYQYIQDGVDAANNGDTVYVFNGTYNEDIEIKSKSIELTGEDQNTTIIWGLVFISYVSGLTLSFFTFQPGEDLESLAVLYSSKCTFTRNTFKAQENLLGFETLGLSDSTISFNTFQLSGEGAYGFIIGLSSGNTITKNNFIGDGYSDTDGLNIGTSSNNVISENFFTNVCYAIAIGSAYPNTNRDNVISNNTITQGAGGVGIALGTFSTHNVVSGNNISNNDGDGIILLDNANENLICKNIISNNTDNGVIIIGSYYNKIIANTISDSGKTGIYLPATIPSSESKFNYFYYNNIERNGVCNAYDNYINIWYKPIGLFRGEGNYWDDYIGKDNNGDGIGDTPYKIPGAGGNRDKYPFMAPVDIDDVVVGEVEEFINEIVNEYKHDIKENEINSLYLTKESLSSYIGMYQYHCQSSTPLFFQILQRVANIR